MRIGLIADLAIGMDAGGSHAWSRQQDLVVGLNVGAPPDLFNPLGQDWGLTAFSPHALVAGGFAAFVTTLRAALRNAGGVRIDHAMGLRRLWLVPEGAPPAEGAYLTYPLDDLVRLIKLELFRHQGHRHRRRPWHGPGRISVKRWRTPASQECACSGSSAKRKDFRTPRDWPADAVAMTLTHDLPTVAGWWRGADIDARAEFGLLAPGTDQSAEQRDRVHDRELLWAAFRDAGAADAPGPPNDDSEAVDAAVRFVAATPAHLALIPLEDLLGLPDQPNLPGTIDQHPNWRRRYPGAADALFAAPQVARRARFLQRRTRT